MSELKNHNFNSYQLKIDGKKSQFLTKGIQEFVLNANYFYKFSFYFASNALWYTIPIGFGAFMLNQSLCLLCRDASDNACISSSSYDVV